MTLDHDPAAGRSCPLHYRYLPEVFATPPTLDPVDVLYVAGGLYGNELALERLLACFAAERGRTRLVFNGDFHWFDADPDVFSRVQRGVLAHTALRGNVETELAAEAEAHADADPGCGCAYPDWVDDQVVARSNRILRRLRAASTPAQRAELAALPMWLRLDVGPLRLGIVHGDAQSLAGWGFAQEHLRDPVHRDRLRAWFRQARVDAFASSHTCLPVFQRLRGAPQACAAQPHWIFNNGAAGMPNFTGDPAGLLTRVALTPFVGARRRFGVRIGEVFVDAIAIDVDPRQAQARFLRQWPPGSDAYASYFQRIVQGPRYRADDAIRREE
ncbi:hypothetical protein JI739_00090 [Ramlibacter sp. AW1]|uniref:Metallophosphatase family protein n=1 Tax=Ramlibacter aurantiacus TaxID=2801330 RepID=A0A937D5H4_9BURK|nr:hypothetical protein [Ramlibacter aurantiacus]MBL0418731.1 hypothetical protein [Ramlibacter aurantiacus]